MAYSPMKSEAPSPWRSHPSLHRQAHFAGSYGAFFLFLTTFSTTYSGGPAVTLWRLNAWNLNIGDESWGWFMVDSWSICDDYGLETSDCIYCFVLVIDHMYFQASRSWETHCFGGLISRQLPSSHGARFWRNLPLDSGHRLSFAVFDVHCAFPKDTLSGLIDRKIYRKPLL